MKALGFREIERQIMRQNAMPNFMPLKASRQNYLKSLNLAKSLG